MLKRWFREINNGFKSRIKWESKSSHSRQTLHTLHSTQPSSSNSYLAKKPRPTRRRHWMRVKLKTMGNITSTQCTTISIEEYCLNSSQCRALARTKRSRKKQDICVKALTPTKTTSLRRSMTSLSTKTRYKHSNWQMVAKSWLLITIIRISISILNQATRMTWSAIQFRILARWHLWTDHHILIIKSLRVHLMSIPFPICGARTLRQGIEQQLCDIIRNRSRTKAIQRLNHILTRISQSEAASTIRWIVALVWLIMHPKGLESRMKKRNSSRRGLSKQPNKPTKEEN